MPVACQTTTFELPQYRNISNSVTHVTVQWTHPISPLGSLWRILFCIGGNRIRLCGTANPIAIKVSIHHQPAYSVPSQYRRNKNRYTTVHRKRSCVPIPKQNPAARPMLLVINAVLFDAVISGRVKVLMLPSPRQSSRTPWLLCDRHQEWPEND